MPPRSEYQKVRKLDVIEPGKANFATPQRYESETRIKEKYATGLRSEEGIGLKAINLRTLANVATSCAITKKKTGGERGEKIVQRSGTLEKI